MARKYLRHLKGGYIWYVDYMNNGKRCRLSTGTSNEKQAELFRADIEVKIAKGFFGFDEPKRKEVRLADFVQEYLQYSNAEKEESTHEIDSRALKHFVTLVGNVLIGRVTAKDGEDFKLKRVDDILPVSVNIELRQLKAAFQKAVAWRYLEQNPLRDVKQYRVKSTNVRNYLTKSEINIVLNQIPESVFKSFVLFCLYTGCRRGEALNLNWEDVDFVNKQVTFHVTKNGKRRVIPLNSILNRVLQNMDMNGVNPFPFSEDYVTHKFKKYLRSSGIKNCESLRLHSLRHTFASHLVMSGVDLLTVSKLLGHSTVRVTEMYAHLMPNHMMASVERLKY